MYFMMALNWLRYFLNLSDIAYWFLLYYLFTFDEINLKLYCTSQKTVLLIQGISKMSVTPPLCIIIIQQCNKLPSRSMQTMQLHVFSKHCLFHQSVTDGRRGERSNLQHREQRLLHTCVLQRHIPPTTTQSHLTKQSKYLHEDMRVRSRP